MEKISRWLKKYFIPHAENLHKPHFLRAPSVLALLSVILVIELAFLAQAFFVFRKTSFLAAVLPGVITSLTNESREANGVPPLSENEILDRAAQLKAEDMAAKGYFSHTSPDGKLPWYWLDKAGYEYSYAGENLAVNFFDSEDVAMAWMNSPAHQENVVKKDFTEIGIGVAKGIYEGRETVFVAEFFGTPSSAKATRASSETSQGTARSEPSEALSELGPFGSSVDAAPQKIAASAKSEEGSAAAVAAAPDTVSLPVATRVLGEETIATQNSPMISASPKQNPAISLINRILTSPRQFTARFYAMLYAFILAALALAFFIKIKIQHPKLIASGIALVLMIGAVTFVNLNLPSLNVKSPVFSDSESYGYTAAAVFTGINP